MTHIPGQSTMPPQSFYLQVMGVEQGPFDQAQLSMMVRSGQVKPDGLVRSASAPAGMYFPARDVPGLFSSKEWLVALLISVFLGTLGIDRFYVGHVGLGILKLVTCGGMGIWAIIDIILIATRKVNDSNGLPLR